MKGLKWLAVGVLGLLVLFCGGFFLHLLLGLPFLLLLLLLESGISWLTVFCLFDVFVFVFFYILAYIGWKTEEMAVRRRDQISCAVLSLFCLAATLLYAAADSRLMLQYWQTEFLTLALVPMVFVCGWFAVCVIFRE